MWSYTTLLLYVLCGSARHNTTLLLHVLCGSARHNATLLHVLIHVLRSVMCHVVVGRRVVDVVTGWRGAESSFGIRGWVAVLK